MPFPSHEQELVINHRGSPLIVVAGPGTGKTRTLVERMIQLLQEDHSREVSLVTFTRTSMRDTERKLVQALGEEILEIINIEFPRVSTLHTYAKGIVHRYGHSISLDPAFSILLDSRGERSLVISEVLSDINLDFSVEDVSKAISEVRATHEWPAQFIASDIEKQCIIERLNILLQLYRTLDMEGVLLAACEILDTPGAHLPQLFLQVDEYQDLNTVDQEFVSLLSSHPLSQIVVVGDDAQSIYGFRHANLNGVRDLWESHEWEGICFPDSFRLEPHILNSALDLIGGTEYLGARINRKTPNENRIQVLQCTTPNLQIEAIARDINIKIQRAQEDPEIDLCLDDFLILCPTGSQVEQVVNTLNDDFNLQSKSPLKPRIPDDFWNLLLFLRMASTSDPLALRQWLPLIGYTQQEINQLRLRVIDLDADFFEFVSVIDDDRISDLVRNIDAIRAESNSRVHLLAALELIPLLNVPDVLSDLLCSWENNDGILPSLGTLINLIYQHLGIFEGEQRVEEDDRILVATMHSSKGLEAAYVYCTWMSSTFMPLPGRDLDEQKRILYVALTRAKIDVLVTFPERYDRNRNRRLGREAISPFIEEIIDHIELIRITAPSIRGDQLPWRT